MRSYLLLCLLTCLGPCLYAQYTIKSDSVKITNYDSSELILENHTQNVPGFLYNKGNGRTEFRRALIPLNDTLYVFGKDTLNINKGIQYRSIGSGGGGTSVVTLNRVFKVYSLDYGSGSPMSHTYTLIGWNVDYSAFTDTAHTITTTIEIEMTLPQSTPAGTVISITFQGTTIYTMTVTSALTAEHYAIGTVKVNQDIKYPTQFYIKGAVESITGDGVITTTNTAYRYSGALFSNPTMIFSSSTTSLTRIGATYTVDKKGPGNWIIN